MLLEIDQLRRDWIEGLSGEDFYARVVEFRGGLGEGLLVIQESDPFQFAVELFAAASMGTPIVLTNPNWGTKEQKELQQLLEVEDSAHGSILIPTGGTTGGVKLAVHSWQSLVSASEGVQKFLGGGAIDSCCLLPLYHVSGLMQLVRSFVSGGRIRFDDSVVEGYCLSLVPTQLQRAIQSEESIQKLNTARVIFVGGGPMSEELAQKARDLKLPVIPVYGMTETAAMCAAIPNEDFLSSESVGAVPIGDARFSTEDEGRIRIKSSALFRGYHGRDPIDLADGYLTGDLGELDAGGRLHVSGRADRIIISGGEKVDPGEVEAALRSIEGVSDVAVVGLPDPEWGQRVVAFYAGKEIADWKRVLSKILAAYKIPKQCIQLDALPYDDRGKIVPNVGASLVKTAEDKHGRTCNDAVFTSEAPTKKTLPVRKTQNLRKGRISIPGARYFLTLCTKDRHCDLINSTVAQSILEVWRLQHSDGDYTFHCGTVMPDHIHFIFTLGDRLELGQAMIKFKAKTKDALKAANLEWQRDFYDHRLRGEDAMEGFAKYIYLNPYRKGLLVDSDAWPHWHLNGEYTPEFSQQLNDNGGPPEEWIGDGVGARELIASDLVFEAEP